jgi:hypothetical protein
MRTNMIDIGGHHSENMSPVTGFNANAISTGKRKTNRLFEV